MTPDTVTPGTGGEDRTAGPVARQRPAGLRPPLTPAQLASRRRADAELFEKYAGQDVAFIDTWTGDTLDRVVVAASADPAEFQSMLRRLDPETRRRIDMTSLPDPDGFDAPSVELA